MRIRALAFAPSRATQRTVNRNRLAGSSEGQRRVQALNREEMRLQEAGRCAVVIVSGQCHVFWLAG
jgi:hypothetical protein